MVDLEGGVSLSCVISAGLFRMRTTVGRIIGVKAFAAATVFGLLVQSANAFSLINPQGDTYCTIAVPVSLSKVNASVSEALAFCGLWPDEATARADLSFSSLVAAGVTPIPLSKNQDGQFYNGPAVAVPIKVKPSDQQKADNAGAYACEILFRLANGNIERPGNSTSGKSRALRAAQGTAFLTRTIGKF